MLIVITVSDMENSCFEVLCKMQLKASLENTAVFIDFLLIYYPTKNNVLSKQLQLQCNSLTLTPSGQVVPLKTPMYRNVGKPNAEIYLSPVLWENGVKKLHHHHFALFGETNGFLQRFTLDLDKTHRCPHGLPMTRSDTDPPNPYSSSHKQ